MDNCIEVYNIFARAVEFINQIDQIDKIEKFFIKDNDWMNNVKYEINSFVPQLFNSSNEIEYLEIGVIKRTDFIEKLDACVRNYIVNNEGLKLMRLLQIVDEAMSKIIDNMPFGKDELVEFNSLNSNVVQTGVIILPYCDCIWQRSGRGKQHGYKFNHCLQKMYCIIVKKLKGLQVKNVMVDETFFYQAKKSGNLLVGLSALTNEDIIHYQVCSNERGERYFDIDRVNCKELLKDRLIKVINKAKNQNIDILIFPELLGYKQLNEEIEAMIANDIMGQYPPLIVLPSVWENSSNISYIILEGGKGVIKQAKQNPMIFKGNIQENIIPDNTLYVIHCPGIGRICTLICADMLNFDYLDIVLNEINASLILVPSFSSGSYDFKNTLDRCRAYDCTAIWINTCSALHLDKEKKDNFSIIGEVLESGKNSNRIHSITCDKMCQKCNEICLFEENINIDPSLFRKKGDIDERNDSV